MNKTQNEIFFYTLIAVFSIPLFLLNIHILHGWGDDFSQYIKQAMNIAAGKPYYESNYIFNPNHADYGPPQYPPGFSILLAPIVKIAGLDFVAMQYLISACLAALLFTLFSYYRKYTNNTTALCLALLCVYAGSVMEMKNQVISDIPCWLFVSLYFTLRKNEHFSPMRIGLLVLTATMAILTRTQALGIVVAELGYLFIITVRDLVRKRQLNFRVITNSVSFKISILTVVLFCTLNQIVFHSPNSTLGFYQQLLAHHYDTWWSAISSNTAYFHELMLRVFHYYANNAFLNTLCHFAVYFLLTFIFLGFILIIKRQLEVSHIFVVVICVPILILSQRQGVRFALYLMPFMLLYAHSAMRTYLPPLLNVQPTKLAVILTTVYLLAGKDDFERYTISTPDNYIPAPKDLVAFQYIKEHISDSNVIVFAKARALTLFTNKRTIVASPYLSYAGNKAQFDTIAGTKYVLVNDALGYEMNEFYREAPNYAADTAEIAEGYHLYLMK
jgi:hypothetical protein